MNKEPIKPFGLLELPRDNRDFRLGSITRLPKLSELPREFKHESTTILDQDTTDFCTGFSSCSASELQEGIRLVPEYQFALTKELMGGNVDEFGADLRTAMKSHVKVGALKEEDRPIGFTLQEKGQAFLRRIENWPPELKDKAIAQGKGSFVSVSGFFDDFDDIRATIYAFRNEKRVPVFGVKWGWDLSNPIISTIPQFGTGHAIYAIGWKEINGEPYLIIPNSFGTEVGDKGYFYLSRGVINSFVSIYGAFMFIDMTKEEFIQRLEDAKKSKVQKVIELILRLFGILKTKVDSLPVETLKPVIPVKEALPEEAPSIMREPKYHWDTLLGIRESIKMICGEEGLNDEETKLICAVIRAESGFNTKVINKNGDGTYDYGLCQYNSFWYIANMKLLTKEEALNDPEKCVRVMIQRYKKGFLKDWVAYKSGAYKKYL